MPDSMQLADELPMIYTVCIMGFATFSYKKSAPVKVLVGLIMAAIAGGITVRNPPSPPPAPFLSQEHRGVSSQAAYADQQLPPHYRPTISTPRIPCSTKSPTRCSR